MSKITTMKPGYYGTGSYEVSPSAGPGEGAIRRCTLSRNGLVERPLDGINTVYDIVEYAARTHGTKDALGWREIVKVVEEEKEVTKVIDGKEVKEKKKWKFFELSDYQYHSYIAVKDIVSEIARGLISLGITTDDVFNIYAQTSPNWQLMAHACGSISTTIATAYDTLGEDGLAHSLNEPGCVGLFTNAELLPTLHRVLAKTPTVKYVVFDGEPTPELVADLDSVREDVKVYSIQKLRELGRDHPLDILDARRPKPDTIACIMYTSGSTGNPKGVMISHANLVASVGAVSTLLGHHLTTADTFLAYLPLAHVLEYIVELVMLFVGAASGYGRVKTLTDASVRNCKGDISAFRPSIMIGVPAVWETIRKGILAKVHAGGALKRTVFNASLSLKKKHVPVLAHLADSVLAGVRAATGGRLRIALSGGAAISRETQEFLTTALVTVLQGYGMTETCGMCSILPPEMMAYNTVGVPVPSCEVKLMDVPDAGYFSTNNPPQGEVCIRGPSVVQGYYKRPDLNADESVFKDGWLRTGDVGQWNPDGTLSIIDRLKNLIKLASGEYIALERLECIYKSCNLVANICVHAVPEASQPMAIIIPHEAHLRNLLHSSSSSIDSVGDISDWCNRQEVAKLIQKECNAVGKKNGFKGPELLQAVVLTPDEWTPESGLVTAAQKIQRTKIAKAFRSEIEAVYKH